MGTLGHIGKGNQRAINRRFGFPAVQIAGIDSYKDVGSRAGKRSKLHKDLPQVLGIDLTVLKGFIQARPTPLEQRRERQLGKAVSRRFTRERVHCVEERITRLLETPVDRVTKFVHRVKVHLENAPSCFFVWWNITPSGDLLQEGIA